MWKKVWEITWHFTGKANQYLCHNFHCLWTRNGKSRKSAFEGKFKALILQDGELDQISLCKNRKAYFIFHVKK